MCLVGQFVDEAFGEEGGEAVRLSAHPPRRQANRDRHVIDRHVGDLIRRHGSRNRHRIGLTLGREHRLARAIAFEQALAEFKVGRRGGYAGLPGEDLPGIVGLGPEHGGGRHARQGAKVLLPARPGQLDRLANFLRDQGRLHRMGMRQPRIEAAARRDRIEDHVLDAYADRLPRRAPGEFGGLRRQPQLQLAIAQPGSAARGFKAAVQGWRDVIAQDKARLVAHRLIGIADRFDPVRLGITHRLVERGIDPVALRCIASSELGGKHFKRAVGFPPCACNRRKPAIMLHQPNIAGQPRDALFVIPRQPREPDRPARDGGKDHVGQAHVAREDSLPGDLAGAIKPRVFRGLARRKVGRLFPQRLGTEDRA